MLFYILEEKRKQSCCLQFLSLIIIAFWCHFFHNFAKTFSSLRTYFYRRFFGTGENDHPEDCFAELFTALVTNIRGQTYLLRIALEIDADPVKTWELFSFFLF
ncbi:hypothetical protein XENTR_v10011686 [Xenopus tropicalis]|nr:hypothetical protein XENTR_v10011686 [Xenopus tropicalis]